MNFSWTDGPELNILLVRENGMDYAAEVRPDDDMGGHYWEIHRNNRWERSGKNADRDAAKREAETALDKLIGDQK